MTAGGQAARFESGIGPRRRSGPETKPGFKRVLSRGRSFQERRKGNMTKSVKKTTAKKAAAAKKTTTKKATAKKACTSCSCTKTPAKKSTKKTAKAAK